MHRKTTTSILLAGAMFIGLCFGCGEKKDPNQKATFRVKGWVTIDDEVPTPPVQLVCHLKGGEASDDTVAPSCVTNEDGTFEFITYKSGDGVPAGDYVITATWKDFDIIKRAYKEPDKLKGRYSNPKKSKIELNVENQPVDMGQIELTTK